MTECRASFGAQGSCGWLTPLTMGIDVIRDGDAARASPLLLYEVHVSTFLAARGATLASIGCQRDREVCVRDESACI